MKTLFLSFILLLSNSIFAQTKTIHVFVSLCDNEFQGIAPVPEKIGNGKDPAHNLYWGCGYGVKSFFKYKAPEWKLVKTIAAKDTMILERVLFKHTSKDVYLLADAYDGEQIKPCIQNFLKASNGQDLEAIKYDSLQLKFGGGSDLISFVGHDGLMEFDADVTYKRNPTNTIEVMILSCNSKMFFGPEIKKSGAKPVLWTTHLMAPEAYTLKSAIDGWLKNETGVQIEERAAQTYNQYQKCGLRGARNLFTTGF